ncbi:lipid II-degrading bacteriocin [Pseudomonas thivervalensis]|uniref:lipid II-degrading bacteriocin n=1 Tax=Pseudomonas thivervalensis TaxID=86265 RepID=UPI00069D06B5|nr:lipid II-degrading bacteriocin [Pseudomonas thivervalensis]
MKQNGIDLPPTQVNGTWRGSIGGYWSTDGIIIDGTYIFPPPQPDVLTEDDDFYITDLIKTQTGLDEFTFNLKILDKAINHKNAYGAIKDVWRIVERERGWVTPYLRVNDVFFKNKAICFSLADALERSGFTSREAIIAIAHSKYARSTTFKLETPKLSGGTFSPVKALAHYLWGKGEKLEVDINTIGLQIREHKLSLLKQTIESTKSPGTYHLVDPKVAYDTGKDSLISGAYLGRITLRVEGDFTRNQDTSWQFLGTVKAYHDFYDFDKSDRPLALEQLTTAGRALPGTGYEINISGEHKIHLIGKGFKTPNF